MTASDPWSRCTRVSLRHVLTLSWRNSVGCLGVCVVQRHAVWKTLAKLWSSLEVSLVVTRKKVALMLVEEISSQWDIVGEQSNRNIRSHTQRWGIFHLMKTFSFVCDLRLSEKKADDGVLVRVKLMTGRSFLWKTFHLHNFPSFHRAPDVFVRSDRRLGECAYDSTLQRRSSAFQRISSRYWWYWTNREVGPGDFQAIKLPHIKRHVPTFLH